MKNFTYCGLCYWNDEKVFPFGFCEKCWIKHGKPQAMNGDVIAE